MALRPAPIKLGVVGYGVGGRYFHTPFIEAAEGVELAGVVTRSPVRRSEVEQDWPGVPVFDSLGALLDSGVDAVTITTPPDTRRELVLEALSGGVHVVADKPFAPTADVGRELAAAAESSGLLLSVFHNRRWDADIRTLAAVIDSGRLGELWRVHSRFDLDDPETLEAGPGGGLLRDLGSHVVDQMVWLLGDVRSVNAHLDWLDLPEGRTDAGFTIEMEHAVGGPFAGGVEQGEPHRGARAAGIRQRRQLSLLGHRRPGAGDLRGPNGRWTTSRPGATRSPSGGVCCHARPAPSRCRPSRAATTTSTRPSPLPYAERVPSRYRPGTRSAPSRCSMQPASARTGGAVSTWLPLACSPEQLYAKPGGHLMTQPSSGPAPSGSASSALAGWVGCMHARGSGWLLTIPSWRSDPCLSLLVTTLAAKTLERSVLAHGFAELHRDWRDLLARDDLDVVSVCGPNHLHREMGVAVAESGRHLWIEKPAGRNAAETAEIAAAVEKAGVQSAAGFNYRNAPAVEHARQLVLEGALGILQTVEVRFLADYAAHPQGALSWRFLNEQAGSGVLGDLASHAADLARYVAGEVVELVADDGRFITVGRWQQVPGRTSPVGSKALSATSRTRTTSGPSSDSPRGARGTLVAGRTAVGEQCGYEIAVHGDRGAFAWDFRRMGELRTSIGADYQDSSYTTVLANPAHGEFGAFQPGGGIAMGYDDLKVIEALRLAQVDRGRRAGRRHHHDALRAAELVDAMQTSVIEHRWVSDVTRLHTVPVGLIGAGRIGSSHAEIIARRVPGADLVAVADPRPGVAATLAHPLGARGGPTIQARYSLRRTSTRSSSRLPVDAHCELVVAAAQAGKAVFCEKPMSLNLPDADRAIAAARDAGVQLQVGFNRRFATDFAAAHALIVDGAVGTPQLMRSVTRDPGLANPGGVPPWTVFTQTLIHDFDALLWLNPGASPVEVYATADALVAPEFKRLGPARHRGRRDHLRQRRARRGRGELLGHLRLRRPRRGLRIRRDGDGRRGAGEIDGPVRRLAVVISICRAATSTSSATPTPPSSSSSPRPSAKVARLRSPARTRGVPSRSHLPASSRSRRTHQREWLNNAHPDSKSAWG